MKLGIDMTITECATSCGDVSFKKKPFDEIDGLILSNIIYCDFNYAYKKLGNFESVPLDLFLKALLEKYKNRKMKEGLFLGRRPSSLAQRIAKTLRYRDMIVSDFEEMNDESKNLQFAAICFHIYRDLIFLCYRGTDDSLMGWMENLDLFLEERMPSQVCGLDYLNRMMKKYPDATFILGGHSKGGNIAVYAATYCQDVYQDRIQKIYSYDGTGFYPGTFDYERFEKMQERTLLVVPFDCVVGNILEQPIRNRIIVACTKKGLFCHDIHTWRIEKNHFILSKRQIYSNRSLGTVKGINEMVYNDPIEKRRDFIEDFNRAVKATPAKMLIDLKKRITLPLQIYKNLSLRSKTVIIKTIRILVANNLKID